VGRFDGKVALITGAARGQGRTHAVAFAREGADVIALDICRQIEGVPYEMATADDLAETERLVKEAGGRIVVRPVDVRDFDALEAAVKDGVQELGRLDIVVANAGIGTFGPAEELTEREWRDVIDVDLIGVWLTCKATIPVIEDKGNFILTSSTMGLSAVGNATHYVAAKHGVVGLMLSLAQELAPRGIRVNSVHPTQVAGEMIFNQGMYDLFRPDLESPTQEDMAEVSAQTSLLGVPWIESQDVSNAVLFLVSDEARYITGVALPVDAGSCLK
jgi:(+)-trans-carveol dehydrogenase